MTKEGQSEENKEEKGGENRREGSQEEGNQGPLEDPEESHKRRRKEAVPEVAEEIKEAEDEVDMLIETARREAYKDLGGKVWAPIQVHYKGRVRHLCDGLGKCSPGVRPAGHRIPPISKKAADLRRWFWAEVEELEKGMSKGERLRWISKLVLGRFESSPFEGKIEDLRRRMDERLVSLGLDPGRKESDRRTPINFRRVKAWAEAVEDEDFQFLDGLLKRGVPLGVRGEIPWVSNVYLVTTAAMGGHLVQKQLGPTPLAVVNGFGIFEGGHPHVRAWARGL